MEIAKTVKLQNNRNSLEWWKLIFEKRCVCYMHSQGSLKKRPKRPFNINNGWKYTLKIT